MRLPRTFSPLRAWAPTAIALLSLQAAAAGCNRASCDGLHSPSTAAEAPALILVEMLDSQPNNPWGLVFALSFEGGAGHVAGGNLLIYTGAGAPATLPLQNAFASSSLSFAATAGRIAVPLTLAQGGVQDDTVVRLGFQIEDATKLYSNCYTLDIHVDITYASGPARLRPTVVWAGACEGAPKGGRLQSTAVRVLS